jgi:hypothetical protein
VTGRDQRLTRRARTRKHFPKSSLIRIERRHRHDAAHTQSSQPVQSLPFRRHAVQREPSLRRLTDDVDLQQNVDWSGVLSSNFVHHIREPTAVDGVHEIEPRHVPGLVPLQVADEVPPNVGAEDVHFFERLLNAVLTDVPEPCRIRRLDSIWPMRFCHGHQRDSLATASALCSRIDAIPNLPQSLRQVRQSHNTPSYRRLQSEASESLCALFGLANSDNRGQESRPRA